MKLALLAAIVILNISNCSSPESFTEITFGEGGGFTGFVTEHTLKANGELFKNAPNNQSEKIKTVDKSQIRRVESKLNKLASESLRFNHPHNISYFITIEKGNEKINIVWGDPSFPVPNDVGQLYTELKNIIKP